MTRIVQLQFLDTPSQGMEKACSPRLTFVVSRCYTFARTERPATARNEGGEIRLAQSDAPLRPKRERVSHATQQESILAEVFLMPKIKSDSQLK
jgi:hypothetical protein